MRHASSPRSRDARLGFDPYSRLVGEGLVAAARADSAVLTVLNNWLDSLAVDAEQRFRAVDWTVERDGKRWGLSPFGIHLGSLTIPVPIGFAPTAPQRRAFEQAMRDRTAIQLQDLRASVRAATDGARARRRADTLGVRSPQ